MDFNDTATEATFRQQVRTWLDENAIPKQSSRDTWNKTVGNLSGDEILRLSKEWQKKLYDAGWACLHWPKAFGGRDASPMERVIWGQEISHHLVPGEVFAIGQGMCGPTLMAYADDATNRTYLPPMASGEHIWCQLFSEPSAGSDIAGLRTKAVRDGDDWVINGQKIWTSGAHYSDYGILLLRTNPDVPKHKGLTMFWIDMHDPAVSARPIRQISGASDFNEVYFTDLRVADTQRLGEPGQGWQVALTTLMNERLAVGDATGADFDELYELARDLDLGDDNGLESAAVRSQLADWYCEQSGLKFNKYRTISALSRGQTPGPESSITKIVSARKLQQIGMYGTEMLDIAGAIRGHDDSSLNPFMEAFIGSPGLRIAGGTDEILRNIIAERVLGLPQDIRVDKTAAFSELD